MSVPYVGITGIVTFGDVETAWQCTKLLPPGARSDGRRARDVAQALDGVLNGGDPLAPHHPVYDATQSALVAHACLERLWRDLP